ncbi:hypothetical protein L1987_77028 [Smallanthus sonchifolius]|uniref:Uncharacterized protein n=1 Tax=Smallanthus sonchifolius TaxID=185202 RepID=A0ACB8Z8U7_9ASTR|nr:hypothetical protein L1987_77028 [Smallanthus sonchifolius]
MQTCDPRLTIFDSTPSSIQVLEPLHHTDHREFTLEAYPNNFWSLACYSTKTCTTRTPPFTFAVRNNGKSTVSLLRLKASRSLPPSWPVKGRSLSKYAYWGHTLPSVGVETNRVSGNNVYRRYLSNSTKFSGFTYARLFAGSFANSSGSFRFYSSDGDGRNTSEDKHVPLKDVSEIDKGIIGNENVKEDVNHHDAHARLGDQDQKEWLINEKLAIESKRKESPFLTKRQRFKNEFLRRIVPWEKQTVSWDTFPYYVHEHSKNLLVECAASHLKKKKFTSTYGSRLDSSSGRILLQSVPGTELYQERVIRALAQDLQVPLLILDSSILAPYEFGEDNSENESDEEHGESGEEIASESEVDDDASNDEELSSSGDSRSDDEDAEARAVEALKKLVPGNLDDIAKNIAVVSREISLESSQQEEAESYEEANEPLKKGDRVKYVGPSVRVKEDARIKLGSIATSDGIRNAYAFITRRCK